MAQGRDSRLRGNDEKGRGNDGKDGWEETNEREAGEAPGDSRLRGNGDRGRAVNRVIAALRGRRGGIPAYAGMTIGGAP